MNYVICDAGAEHLPQLEMLERCLLYTSDAADD